MCVCVSRRGGEGKEKEGERKMERERDGRGRQKIWRKARKTMMGVGERDPERDGEGERWRKREVKRGEVHTKKKEQKEERQYRFMYLFPSSLSLTALSPLISLCTVNRRMAFLIKTQMRILLSVCCDLRPFISLRMESGTALFSSSSLKYSETHSSRVC